MRQQLRQFPRHQTEVSSKQIIRILRLPLCIFLEDIEEGEAFDLQLLGQIQKTMRECELSKKYSPRLLLGEMEALTRINYTGKYKDITSEVSKSQREIFEAFSIDPNTL